MKLIELTQGYQAMVDDDIYEYLNQWKWFINRVRNTDVIYVIRKIKGTKPRKAVKMHRVIMGVTDPNVIIDHKDSNGLNNQRSNLREATKSQNNINSRIRKGGSSIYKGVSLVKDCPIRPWRMQCGIGIDKQYKRFATQEEAAIAYNEMATRLYGEFAKLNIVIETDNNL